MAYANHVGLGIDTSPIRTGSIVEAPPKPDFMLELMASQAVLESQAYAVLDWDELEGLKRKHTALQSKSSALQRSLALETRLRDSTAKLSKFGDNSDELARADARIGQLSQELCGVQAAELTSTQRLLRHTAAVLARAHSATPRTSVQSPSFSEASSYARPRGHSSTQLGSVYSSGGQFSPRVEREGDAQEKGVKRQASGTRAGFGPIQEGIEAPEPFGARHGFGGDLETLAGGAPTNGSATRDGEDAQIRELKDLLTAAEAEKTELATSLAAAEEAAERDAQNAADCGAMLTAVLSAVAQSLQKSRENALLRPILDEVDPFDPENADGDVAAHVETTLDWYFDCVSTHVATRATELGGLHESVAQKENEYVILQQSMLAEVDALKRKLADEESRHAATRSAAEEHSATADERGAALEAREAELAQLHSVLRPILTRVSSTRALGGERSVSSFGGDARAYAPDASSERLTTAPLNLPLDADTLGNQLNQHLDEHDSLKMELTSLRETKTAPDTADDVTQLKTELATLQMAEMNMANEKNEIESRLNSLVNERTTLQSRVQTLEAVSLKNETLQKRIQELESELSEHMQREAEGSTREVKASTAVPSDTIELTSTIQDLRDQIDDLQAELEDAKARELSQRTHLLQELSAAQQETSSLKTRLRQEQRRLERNQM